MEWCGVVCDTHDHYVVPLVLHLDGVVVAFLDSYVSCPQQGWVGIDVGWRRRRRRMYDHRSNNRVVVVVVVVVVAAIVGVGGMEFDSHTKLHPLFRSCYFSRE